MRSDELPVILVWCDHADLVACLDSLAAQRADQVVRLVPFDPQQRYLVSLHQLFDIRHREAYRLGGLGTIGLVLRVLLVSKGPSRHIHRYGDVVGSLLINNVL